MKQSPSWEADKSSVCQGIPCILWNLKVHYHIYKSLPQARGNCERFTTWQIFLWWRVVSPLPYPTSWRTTPYRLYATSYLIFISSLHIVGCSSTCNMRCTMLWWPEPTRFNIKKFYILLTECFYVSCDTCNKQWLYPQTALTITMDNKNVIATKTGVT